MASSLQRLKLATAQAEFGSVVPCGNKGIWTVDLRNGRLFDDDNVTMVKGVAKGKKRKLEEVGIAQVKHLRELTGRKDKIVQTASKMTGIGEATLTKFVQVCQDAVPGAYPEKIDHTKHNDPNKSLHPDTYMDQIKKSKLVAHYCSINDLIDHIFTASAAVFKNTVHEDDWVVYHDALSLMTSAKAVQYMKDKGYYHRLICPKMISTKAHHMRNVSLATTLI